MSEYQVNIIVYGTEDILESTELCFPIPMLIIQDISSLLSKVGNSSKLTDFRLKRYFILLLESIGKDEDLFYTQMEENPQVVSIFHVWNENFIPTFKITKLYYIPKDAISLALSLSIIQFFKNEAEKQIKLDQIPLSKIYLRKAEKTKEWIMSNLRAEPCHILVIPLNTNSTNLTNTIQSLQQYCAKFGYPEAIICPLDDYIPKSEIYHKLPYGKLLFEYEDPRIICRWIRYLSPIRIYLYGNEQVIPNEWSKQMISNEADDSVKLIVNDDDWYTFLENESVDDSIKWNFSAKHGRTWKITQLTPIKLDSLIDNIRFRSSLRRANITYYSRMSTVTAQIFDWFDECLEYGYIKNEFKLTRRDKSIPTDNGKDTRETNLQPLRFDRIEEINYSSNFNEKDNGSYSLTYSPNLLNEIINYYSNKFDRIYIWLDNDFYSIEQRFQSIIYPNQWNSFSNTNECQKFILNQQLQYNPKIYLISSYYSAEQLFTYEHVSNIHVAYLYSKQIDIPSRWINVFPRIRGIYKNLDSLFEQVNFDIATNIELLPFQHQQQAHEDPLPVTFLDIDQGGFKRQRYLIEIVLKLPRTLEAKQEMIDELRRVSIDNNIFLKQINDFELNYHSNAAIQWYTRDSFLYRILNQALRCEDIASIIKHRFFIADLYQNLDELHNHIISSYNNSQQTILTYYRGQSMSSSEIEQFKQHVGKLISINTFFSTTSSLDIALVFAGGSTLEGVTSNKPVIFSLEVNPLIENTRPYANISFYSAYEEEDEVLFALGSVFRIEKVDFLSVNDNIHVIHLKMIDESELPKEYMTNDFSQFVPEQLISDPIYALVGLTSLFQVNEQCSHIKSILEEVDVQFFDNTDDLDHYTKTMQRIQSFVIFIDSQLPIPDRNQQIKLISYAENDMHFNDLIYELLYEMQNSNKKSKEYIKDLYMNVANVYRPSNKTTFYVQLLLSSTSKKKSEEEFKTKFSSSSIITFYQTEPCIYFLESISEPSKIGNGILILQSDDTNIDNIIDRFEQIDSIKHMYICSKNAFNIQYRRIIHGKFYNENDLYAQLYSDNLSHSFIKANEQIDLYKNKNEANRYFLQMEQFYKLMKEYQNQEIDPLE
ncbi:unnamed protein product [Rotaria sordida]|uniref:Uncharacterized protein n=1 Tax=Rotaria sordida TaxID=392033 RepID=A0A813UPY8_9BILA|nr:unnamed protein product [Rotaria sordida]